MRRLCLSNAHPGDVIAETVVNDRGMVILPKGAELTVPVIGRLQKMSITAITIEGEGLKVPLLKTLEGLDARFEGLEDVHLMMAIKTIAREHLMARKEES
ncbi:MAG: hypothetical protein VX910_13050 [Candidatus Latescibacterota bacterium]|nr:hypothetical protein [Candidatus Latescibacterota bacterium]